jgi:hypothetical protein
MSRGLHSFVRMRRGRLFRGWAVLWAVLQFALPAAVANGDARLDRESAGLVVAHVESGTSQACGFVHPASCALCQFVSHATALPHASGSPAIVAVASPRPQPAALSRAPAVLARLSLARAPPQG